MSSFLSKIQEILGMVHKLDDDATAERHRAVEHDRLQGLAMERLQRQLDMLRTTQRAEARKIRREGEQRS